MSMLPCTRGSPFSEMSVLSSTFLSNVTLCERSEWESLRPPFWAYAVAVPNNVATAMASSVFLNVAFMMSSLSWCVVHSPR